MKREILLAIPIYLLHEKRMRAMLNSWMELKCSIVTHFIIMLLALAKNLSKPNQLNSFKNVLIDSSYN